MEGQSKKGVKSPVSMPVAAVGEFVNRLLLHYPVVAPVSKGKEFVFALLASGEELATGYQPTILPPKKVLQQPVC